MINKLKDRLIKDYKINYDYVTTLGTHVIALFHKENKYISIYINQKNGDISYSIPNYCPERPLPKKKFYYLTDAMIYIKELHEMEKSEEKRKEEIEQFILMLKIKKQEKKKRKVNE